MKLRWYIYDEHCLTVDMGNWRQGPRIEWTGPALRRVSAGWDRKPDERLISHWLHGALPENGTFETFVRRGLAEIAQRGMEVGAGTVHHWAWGNADWEYPGAVRFERAEDAKEERGSENYLSLNEEETGDRLREAAEEADRARELRPRSELIAKSSLSGAQGKIGVHINPAGQVLLPRQGGLSSWILKIENRSEWGGEAGVESVCQRALKHLGIDAAETYARIIDGVPVVMSKRSDRDATQGTVRARHQEDWLQAYGKGAGFKYELGGKDSGYASLYAILRRYAKDPKHEMRQLTRVLAAACAMCNGDLHRKNLGLIHSEPGEDFHLALAPVYDFSSYRGVPRTGDNLRIRIAGMSRAWEVDEEHWRRLAEQCRLDPSEVITTARETARDAPEAIATAREECRERDESKDQKTVEWRIDAVIAAAQRYAQIMEVHRIPGRSPPSPSSAGPGPSTCEHPNRSPTKGRHGPQ